jgi:thiamine-phosphate pyrophosphorylase
MTLPRVYGIADASFGDPVALAHSLFNGGIRLIQVRNKTASARELLSQVQAILKFAPVDARLIVNDRTDIAMIAGAGVHVGQGDLPGRAAREILGPSALIGVSTHNVEQAQQADAEPVDYIAVGPVFPTTSKTNPDPVLGLEKLRSICTVVKKPVVAIGGITRENARSVFECGAASVAVISDLLRAADVTERARDWLRYNQAGI